MEVVGVPETTKSLLLLQWVPLTTSKKMQKKLLLFNWILVVTDLFNIPVNDIFIQRNLLDVTGLVITKIVLTSYWQNSEGTLVKWKIKPSGVNQYLFFYFECDSR